LTKAQKVAEKMINKKYGVSVESSTDEKEIETKNNSKSENS
jgi:hypothetical protein